ncbi:L-threonine aldolase [Microlunatus sagamiharensis]|uniref:L-threonine aldolase n=1 Tax=Microlunatus sagamiharensis TaxID=546874 RepID=A0A1H2MQG0_9ACTN|nr:GntG family PLP-dependent aldolase [Microlunatus sagamiharensis]SDU95480.1 L-threonine aldolase [Microlunatus sagamiharensis]
MIDLRSDTVTKPTAAMREAMASAPVGDDVYDEDPSIHALEERAAELLGHEAGLYCPTGSMTNVLGVWLHVAPGTEVLCDVNAHVARAEMGAHGALTGVTMRTWPSLSGRLDAAEVEKIVSPDAGPYLVSTACVAVENTHNFGGGTVQPLDQLEAVGALCRDLGIAFHLDGARMANASVASGVSLETYGRLFDTVSICLSKGLGAPVGSVLVGTREQVGRARVQRKRLGGGWRQAGILAAAGLYALEHHVERLADDHAAAKALAEAVAARAPQAIDPAAVETNIVALDTGGVPATAVVAAAAEQGVRVGTVGTRTVRAVTHLDATLDQAREAGEVLGDVLARVEQAA